MVFRIVAFSFLLAFAAHAEPINVNDITVVDGDTIDFQGSRYRMVGYDTPEISSRWREVSAGEKGLSVIAKERFTELLKSGRLDLTEVRCACSASNIGTNNCNYGRK